MSTLAVIAYPGQDTAAQAAAALARMQKEYLIELDDVAWVTKKPDGKLKLHQGTSLTGVAPGDRVNLERAVTVDKRLGGHIVQGHVDGVGTVLSRSPSEHWEVVDIAMPTELGRYLVDKGSITVDGVSLTVVEARDDGFTVSLIPETLARTTLGRRQVGDRVNLEVDVLAKHVEKLLAAQAADRKDNS